MDTTTVTPDPIVLEGKDIFSVAFLESGLAYKATTQRGKDKKTYSRYQHLNTVFTVPDENPFNLDFKTGQVKSIILIPGKASITTQDEAGEDVVTERDTLAFSNHINRAQWAGLQQDRLDEAKVESMIARYAHLATAPVTMDLLNELENA